MHGDDVNQQTDDRDRGLVLPMVLALTVVLAVVVVAIANYAVTSMRRGTIVRDRTEALAAADGGARIALEKLRTKATSCATTDSVIHSDTINGQTVDVTCRRVTLLQSEVGQFAVVVTGENVASGTASFETGGSDSATNGVRTIGGNVFFAEPPASISKPVLIEDGDLYHYAAPAAGCVTPNYAEVTFSPPVERGYSCTQTTWQDWFAQPTLPTRPTVARGPTGTTDAHDCTIFQPGVYSQPPETQGGDLEVFFRPGTYYFTFSGTWEIKGAMVFGGVSGADGSGSSPAAREPETYAPDRCATAMAAAEAASAPNTGVTWVFGGSSRLDVNNRAHIELFAPPKLAATDIMAPSIIALQTTQGGYAASTATSTGSPLLDLKQGSNNGVVVHGGVWAPGNSLKLGNVAQEANGQFLGTVVVGHLDMQAAASAGGLNFSVPTTPTVTKVVLTSRSLNTEVRVVALVRSATGSMSINSWRVS